MKEIVLALGLLAATSGVAHADVVTFDDVTGPSHIGGSNQTLVYGFADVTATFSGGTVLTQMSFLPADQTSVYASFSGFNTNPITITFSAPVHNFFVELVNGLNVAEDYTIADNAGHSATFSVPPNYLGGLTYYSIPATGTQVTITSAATAGLYDFAIDNVGFNEATPTVPEPASLPMVAMALFGMRLTRRRR